MKVFQSLYYRVVVKRNFVCSITRMDMLGDGHELMVSNLDAGNALAANYKRNGSIDGEYCFADYEQAKSFSLLCLDFVAKQARHLSGQVERLNQGEEFRSNSAA